MDQPCPNLLLAAFKPELAGLDTDPPPEWEIRCTGVGAIAAAATTARAIAELAPTRILFIGTCGAYGDELAIGDLIAARFALATSLDELEGRAYRPSIEQTCWEGAGSLPFPAHGVAVPPGVTRTQEGARLLGALASAEHLELTGVFAAAQAAGIPADGALAVSNHVGPKAHEEWAAHHQTVSRRLVEALRAVHIL